MILLLLSWCVVSAPPAPFERLHRVELAALVQTPSFKQMVTIGEGDLAEHDSCLPPAGMAFAIVKTRGGRFAKIRLTSGRLKTGSGKTEPMILLEQFLTYKDGEQQAFVAKGENRALFPGTRFDLDMGQVVPERLGGDLKCGEKDGKVILEVDPGARLWLATSVVPLPAQPKNGPPVVSDKFQASYFVGQFRFFDDGRRSGILQLDLGESGELVGKFISDKDGAAYPLMGRLGPQPHQVQFGIRFPRTEQIYQGFLFTGDADAIAGTSKVGDRETGFYAKRVTP